MDTQTEIQDILGARLLSIPKAQALVQRIAPGKLNPYTFHNLTVTQKRTWLKNQLKKLSKVQPADLPVVKIAKQIEPVRKSISELVAEEFPKLLFSQLPDTLQRLIIRRYECKRLAVIEHKNMHSAQTNTERYVATDACVRLMKENWEIWAEIDHYHRKGKVLGKHDVFKLEAYDERIATIERTKPAMQAATEFIGMMRTAENRIYKLRQKEGKEELVKRWVERYDLLAVKLNKKKWDDRSTQSTKKGK